ncbi:MAG: Jag N-terminal domain-containing protein [Campylobacteraceae bacterium]|jgi:spoIIIJ-associated protein|nr:Jag N-terminal domain-containing protein [Campylobacteraceae bacterium]
MIQVIADTLEEAYSKAAEELSCSVTELELDVIQYPKKGFLGLGKKNAIVEARKIDGKNFAHKYEKNSYNKNKSDFHNTQHIKKHTEKYDKYEKKEFPRPHINEKKEEKNTETTIAAKASLNRHRDVQKKRKPINTGTQFDEKFHKDKVDPSSIVYEIQEKIKLLFSNLCFEIADINVSVYDDETLLVEIDGADAALLIGKEGCRYKALSYLLYSWVNIKYGFGIRLEIAEFLKNQEEMMGKYLTPIIERIYTQGRGQTKILDGVLIKIALERLRGEFPEKYVGIKNGRDGGRFIVVNDFNRKNT